MFKTVSLVVGKVVLAGFVLVLTGCAYESRYDDDHYYRGGRYYEQRVGYSYGRDRYHDHRRDHYRDGYRDYRRYERCD